MGLYVLPSHFKCIALMRCRRGCFMGAAIVLSASGRFGLEENEALGAYA